MAYNLIDGGTARPSYVDTHENIYRPLDGLGSAPSLSWGRGFRMTPAAGFGDDPASPVTAPPPPASTPAATTSGGAPEPPGSPGGTVLIVGLGIAGALYFLSR